MPTYNKQPLFTSAPIIYNETGDPPLLNLDSFATSNLYQTTEITRIDRITVNLPVNATYTQWATKDVYVVIYNYTNGYFTIYEKAEIAGGTYSEGSALPSITWTFEGGILLPSNYGIGVQASQNYTTTSKKGDYLSVTIEGGTFQQ